MNLNLKLIKKEEIAAATMAFHFKKPEGLEFRAGQFAEFSLIDPEETDSEGNTRAFSLIHAPYEDEIGFATRMRDSAFKRVLSNLNEGDELMFNGPFGDFTLHKTETTPAVFLIGGIGVTPIRSMVAQATHDSSPMKLTLIHANRTPEAPFSQDFMSFASANENFSYVQVVTDDIDNWNGETGRIDDNKLKKYVTDIFAPIYYLSGPEGMVKAMRSLLISLNINEDNIHSEEFPGY